MSQAMDQDKALEASTMRRVSWRLMPFLVVSYLEVLGTSLGTWTWQAHDPTGLVPVGNPPSGIAGGYAWFDAAALFLTPRLLARWDARRASADGDAQVDGEGGGERHELVRRDHSASQRGRADQAVERRPA